VTHIWSCDGAWQQSPAAGTGCRKSRPSLQLERSLQLQGCCVCQGSDLQPATCARRQSGTWRVIKILNLTKRKSLAIGRARRRRGSGGPSAAAAAAVPPADRRCKSPAPPSPRRLRGRGLYAVKMMCVFWTTEECVPAVGSVLLVWVERRQPQPAADPANKTSRGCCRCTSVRLLIRYEGDPPWGTASQPQMGISGPPESAAVSTYTRGGACGGGATAHRKTSVK